jgi:hypothetical protein
MGVKLNHDRAHKLRKVKPDRLRPGVNPATIVALIKYAQLDVFPIKNSCNAQTHYLRKEIYGGSEIRGVLHNILHAISGFSVSGRKGDRGSSRRRR